MGNIFSRLTNQLIAPKAAGRTKYTAFKELLQHDRLCHERLAELEELYYHNQQVDIHQVRRLHRELSDGVSAMVSCLNRMAPAAHLPLRAYYKKIDFYGRIALTPLPLPDPGPFILKLDHPYNDDRQTGGKGLHLSQLKNRLSLPVPEGFIISTSAFTHFLEENDLRSRIDALLSRVDINSNKSLQQTSKSLSELINRAEIPEKLTQEIGGALKKLSSRHGSRLFAVRSSAVAEDSAISFAGQYESLLNVDAAGVPAAYQQVLASKYSPRSIFYRIRNGLLDEDTPMAVLVLEMVNARVSGVIASMVSEQGDIPGFMIHSTKGLGDQLVGGQCAPQTTSVTRDKDGYHITHAPALSLFSTGAAPSPKKEGVPLLNDRLALQLAGWAHAVTFFYQAAQEIEWSVDAQGNLMLLQARASHLQEAEEPEKPPEIGDAAILIQNAETAARGAGCGPVFLLENEDQLDAVPLGAVLVTPVTPPSYVPVLGRINAVVADLGSAADHFASVAREFGIPVLVKTGNGSSLLKQGETVTVWSEGGLVLAGTVREVLDSCQSRRKSDQKTPFHQAFAKAAPFIFPLHLTNPADDNFTPENCRSLHDIIRFVHEKGLQAMFAQSGRQFSRRSGAFLLETPLPLSLYLLDVGGGIRAGKEDAETAGEDDLQSTPLKALLRGLTHPEVNWSRHEHFDWKNFSQMIMGEGIISNKDPAFASYAIVSADYLNLNMRFGYHFAILDTLCGPIAEENYIMLRFAGGGGDFAGISLRLAFLGEILRKLGFSVTIRGDLLDSRLLRYNAKMIEEKLDMVGRLLGATRLMDMVIKDEKMAHDMVEEFMNGRYDFSG